MDFLMRDDAPLSAEAWKALDEAVINTARANLVGRRFIHLYGPLGYGVPALWVDKLSGVIPGTVGFFGGEEGEEVRSADRQLLPLQLIYKDFRLMWRDIAATEAMHAPLDTGPASAAAAMLARAEDELIFHGVGDQPGLLNVPGHLEVAKQDGWTEAGSALNTVAEARAALVNNGAMGPYALVLSPDLYAKLLRVQGQRGRLELELVQVVADAGVFQSPVLKAGEGLLVSCGRDVLDLVIGEDMKVAYIGPENMNHPFRILETIALRVRRPEGICVLN